jgi:isoprenylcysteine carboxyl methyltransferase (ICMT) family protein YpbQ
MNDPEIILPVGSVILMFAVRMKELLTKGRIISGEAKGNLTLRLFLLTGTAMLICALAEFFLRGKKLYWPTFAVGWIILLLSFALRCQAIKALGKFWSLYVEIRQEHEFVRSGPFRWMRHPAYFSMLLELLAVSIVLNAWWSSLIVPLFFLPDALDAHQAGRAGPCSTNSVSLSHLSTNHLRVNSPEMAAYSLNGGLMERRAVITAFGVIAANGCTVPEFWRNVCNGVSGAGPIQLFDASKLPVRMAAEVRDFEIKDFVENTKAGRFDRTFNSDWQPQRLPLVTPA